MAISETATQAKSEVTVDWLPDAVLRSDSPLSEQIYARLREVIVAGRIAPGTALHEPSITKQFGTSRTPVREALLRLRDEGLIDIKKQSGTFVAPIDPDRVVEGMIVRESLEPRLAAMAAEKMTDRILADLIFETGQMTKAVESGNSLLFIASDDNFHRILLDASGFPHIVEIIQRVNAHLDRVRYLSASEPVRAQTALDEHHAMIERLRAGDATGAAEMLLAHLEGSWVLIRELLAQQNRSREEAERGKVSGEETG
ncbi:GntR family transcriptional regulator [Pelagibius sp. Alg239-R121]|uniref:GntR family transcriptional regulator n=1 Tax=Pelagibius sp. Alg239-R121 TaxID=2993448 RepID=UPI0024A7151E|nr:GntR family transcriptional regulator [Pelagibius sp. Alg239-R121]